ncbi:SDR family oxidoreductase [Rothia koreensis]|uniref:SDR family NAD(P)-dependent oxidoreductase n=1 Tax=Rothia koreensis TaxID=592378 RepID=UPI003F291131
MSTTLITGASSGIGEELASRFAQRGEDLVLVARRRDRLEALADRIGDEFGVDVEVIDMDLADVHAARELRDRVGSRRIDTVINNAGFGLSGDVADLDPEDLDAMVKVNCLALTGITSRFLGDMVARNHGTIVNIASTAAYQPVPHMAVYAASKAFVLSLTEALWAETAEHGVRVLAACPGPTETEFFEHAGRKAAVGRMRSAGQVADALMEALDGGSPSFVDGWLNRLIAKGSSFLPKAWVLKIAGAAVN